MAYIPVQHQKYDLLPRCRKSGREVFEYPLSLIDKTTDLIGTIEGLTPYGFRSYEEYFNVLDSAIISNEHIPEAVKLLKQLKIEIHQMNQKEEWSILRYIGPSTGNLLGLTKGKVYYWPTSKDHPVYHGVVDDEEFTSYLYPTNADMWEILEDPTGMAYRTILEKGEGSITKKNHDYILQQAKTIQMEDDFDEKEHNCLQASEQKTRDR